MRTIAKGFILGHATATDAHDLASAETIRGPIAIYDLEIPFDSDGAIAIDSDLGGGHLYLFWVFWGAKICREYALSKKISAFPAKR
jgi:hypothetical protein